jgi:hypothetical protein
MCRSERIIRDIEPVRGIRIAKLGTYDRPQILAVHMVYMILLEGRPCEEMGAAAIVEVLVGWPGLIACV